MAEYKTGRSRTLKITGEVTLRNRYYGKVVPLPEIGTRLAKGDGQVIAPWGGTVTWATDPAGARRSGCGVSAFDGFGGSTDIHDNYAALPVVSDTDEAFTGSYELDVDVEEWVEVTLASDANVTNHFPTRGSLSNTDGLPSTLVRFFEKTKDTGGVSATISCGGVTATSSSTISGESEITYDCGITVECFGTNSSAYCTATASASGADFDSDGFSFSVSGQGSISAGAGSYGAFSSPPDNSTTYHALLGASVRPSDVYSLDLRMRALGAGPTIDYPHEIITTVKDWSGHTSDVSCNPTGTLDIVQRNWSFTGEIGIPGSETTATPSSAAEVQAVSAYLKSSSVSALGEDTSDRRIQWQPYPFEALAAVMAATQAISAGATPTHASPNVTLTHSNLEAYRYLTFTATPSFSGSRNLSLTLGTKQYAFSVNGVTSVTIDLCLASNVPGGTTVDSRETRYPVAPTGPYGPDAGPPIIGGNSWINHGVLDRPSVAAIGGLGAGESLTVTALTLSKTDAHIGVLLPFGMEQLGWTSDTDNTYLDPDVGTWMDGKVGPVWPCRAHIVPFTGTESWSPFTIAQLAGFLADPAGMGSTLSSPPAYTPVLPADGSPLLASSLAAGNLDGYLFDGTDWRDQTWLSIGTGLWACLKADELKTYPGCGNPLVDYDEGAGGFPVYGSKILRGGAEGLMRDRSAMLSAGVELVTDPGGATVDSDTSAADGSYRLQDAKGSHGHKVRPSATPALNRSFTATNRWWHRAGFIPRTGNGDNWNLHTPWGHYHQLGWNPTGSEASYQRSHWVIPPFDSTSTLATGNDDAEWRAAYVPTLSAHVTLVFCRSRSDVYTCDTYDDGATFTTPMKILDNAIHPTIAAIQHGPSRTLIAAAFRYDSGSSGPGTIVAKLLLPTSPPSWSAEFSFTDGSSPIEFEDDTFHFTEAPELAGRLVLTARKSGDDGPTTFYSADHGPNATTPVATWTEI